MEAFGSLSFGSTDPPRAHKFSLFSILTRTAAQSASPFVQPQSCGTLKHSLTHSLTTPLLPFSKQYQDIFLGTRTNHRTREGIWGRRLRTRLRERVLGTKEEGKRKNKRPSLSSVYRQLRKQNKMPAAGLHNHYNEGDTRQPKVQSRRSRLKSSWP